MVKAPHAQSPAMSCWKCRCHPPKTSGSHAYPPCFKLGQAHPSVLRPKKENERGFILNSQQLPHFPTWVKLYWAHRKKRRTTKALYLCPHIERQKKEPHDSRTRLQPPPCKTGSFRPKKWGHDSSGHRTQNERETKKIQRVPFPGAPPIISAKIRRKTAQNAHARALRGREARQVEGLGHRKPCT